jgi:hypothetical protein
MSSKRIRLSPMQGHSLRMLESGGAESLLLVVNLLWALYSDIDRTVFIYEAEEALQCLVRRGYLRLERYGEDNSLSVDELKHYLHIRERLRWNESNENWLWVDESEIGNLRQVELVLTESGKRALRQ